MSVCLLRKAVCVVISFLTIMVTVQAQAQPGADLTRLVVNLPSRTIDLYVNNMVVKEYPVAIGKPSTPTPLGDFNIIDKEIDPWWFPPGRGYSVPSGPANPLGYRWMGFSGNYGIHGTNAPWSIGLAVSNGCIRMYEEDVEELFALVPDNTPLSITYERIKVQINSQGDASIGIYPDIYGYKGISLQEIKAKLTALGLGGFLSDEYLQQLMRNKTGRQVVFAKLHSIKVNDKLLAEQVVSVDSVMYVPIQAVAAELGAIVSWDEKSHQVHWKKQAVPGVIKDGIIYVSPQDLQGLFGGKQKWDEKQNCLIMKTPAILFEGKETVNSVHVANGSQVVPALALAQILQQKVTWDKKRQELRSGCKKIPVQVIDDEPYINVQNIREYFNAAVLWNDEEQVLQLTYPANAYDYSMYIDQMADFVD